MENVLLVAALLCATAAAGVFRGRARTRRRLLARLAEARSRWETRAFVPGP